MVVMREGAQLLPELDTNGKERTQAGVPDPALSARSLRARTKDNFLMAPASWLCAPLLINVLLPGL